MDTRVRSPLEELLDTDPGEIILPSLDETDYRRIRLVNYSMCQFFNNPSPAILLNRLEYHLAQVPNEKKANGLLKGMQAHIWQTYKLNLLDMVFEKIIFPFYTITNVTLLQLVHSAGDIEMRDNVLEPLFIERFGNEENGLEEMQKQINEMNNVHKKFNFDPIFQAISNELFNSGKDAENRYILSSATLVAIEKFNKEYDECQPLIIDKGMQFRWETLEEFKGAYISAINGQWDNHFRLHCDLIEDVVLSRILRYATKNDKQCFNQGLYYLQNLKEPFNRMQKTRDGQDFDEVLKSPSLNFVLDTSCVDILSGIAVKDRGKWWQGTNGARAGAVLQALQNFCQTKISSLPKLTVAPTNQRKHLTCPGIFKPI